MSKRKFSDEEMSKLSRNPCVSACSGKTIAYTYDFKIRALEQHSQGVCSKDIWRRAGFDISRWTNDYTKDCVKAWRGIVRKRGFEGLTRPRGAGAGGRPKIEGATDEGRIKRLELQVKYLKAENDFLARLRAKRAESNSGQRKNTGSSGN